MSPIPPTLLIDGKLFRVELRDERDAESTSYGACRVGTQHIWVSGNICPEQQAATLLHEVIEAINTEHELNLEHSTICTLETTLYQVLIGNEPWWTKEAE